MPILLRACRHEVIGRCAVCNGLIKGIKIGKYYKKHYDVFEPIRRLSEEDKKDVLEFAKKRSDALLKEWGLNESR